jgi:hypothetical protein
MSIGPLRDGGSGVQPETRYARLGRDRIAYQVLGQGPPDLVMTTGSFRPCRHGLGRPRDHPVPPHPGLIRPPDPVRPAHFPLIPISHGRYLAEHIPGAKLIELAGTEQSLSWETQEPVLDHIEQFLTGAGASC